LSENAVFSHYFLPGFRPEKIDRDAHFNRNRLKYQGTEREHGKLDGVEQGIKND